MVPLDSFAAANSLGTKFLLPKILEAGESNSEA